MARMVISYLLMYIKRIFYWEEKKMPREQNNKPTDCFEFVWRRREKGPGFQGPGEIRQCPGKELYAVESTSQFTRTCLIYVARFLICKNQKVFCPPVRAFG